MIPVTFGCDAPHTLGNPARVLMFVCVEDWGRQTRCSGESMCEQFTMSIRSVLPRDRVWENLIDIDLWPKVSNVYADLQWHGPAWMRGSCIVGSILNPIDLNVRYVIERCERPYEIAFVGHSSAGGFATHRTIRLEQTAITTLLKVDAYGLGIPGVDLPGGVMGFLRAVIQPWFRGFAQYCDAEARTGVLLVS